MLETQKKSLYKWKLALFSTCLCISVTEMIVLSYQIAVRPRARVLSAISKQEVAGFFLLKSNAKNGPIQKERCQSISQEQALKNFRKIQV